MRRIKKQAVLRRKSFVNQIQYEEKEITADGRADPAVAIETVLAISAIHKLAGRLPHLLERNGHDALAENGF
jgi:hypothetical protein